MRKNKLLAIEWKICFLIILVFTILLPSNVTALSGSLNVTIIETQDIGLIFTSVNSINDFDAVVDRNANLVKAVFPIKDSGLTVFKNASIISGPTVLPSDRNNLTKELISIRIKLLTKAYLAQRDFTNAIGIVKENYLDPIEPGTTGINFKSGFIDVILVDETQLKTTAHEVSHTFQLCDEYSENEWKIQNGNFSRGCPNGDLNKDGSLDEACLYNPIGSGCPTNTFSKLYAEYRNISDDAALRDVMGESDTPTYPLPTNNFESWISNGSYNALLDRLDVNTDFELQRTNLISELFKYIVIRLTFEQDGTAEVLDAYILEDGFVHNISAFSGNYTIEVLNESGAAISNISFEPGFTITTESGNDTETNLTFVVFALPLNNQTPSSIVFKNKTLTLAEINRTPNVPNVTIMSSLDGEVFDKFVNLTWNASDLDNDTINYAVLISADKGLSFLV